QENPPPIHPPLPPLERGVIPQRRIGAVLAAVVRPRAVFFLPAVVAGEDDESPFPLAGPVERCDDPADRVVHVRYGGGVQPSRGVGDPALVRGSPPPLLLQGRVRYAERQ